MGSAGPLPTGPLPRRRPVAMLGRLGMLTRRAFVRQSHTARSGAVVWPCFSHLRRSMITARPGLETWLVRLRPSAQRSEEAGVSRSGELRVDGSYVSLKRPRSLRKYNSPHVGSTVMRLRLSIACGEGALHASSRSRRESRGRQRARRWPRGAALPRATRRRALEATMVRKWWRW